MGPYDENGDLQVGGSLPLERTLDECNGKIGMDGKYRYYLTPNAPYGVNCFRGVVQGKFSDQGMLAKACPKTGVKSRYCPQQDIAIMDNFFSGKCGELDLKDECVPLQGPFFLFRQDLKGIVWSNFHAIFGWAFLLLVVFPSLVIWRQMQEEELMKDKLWMKKTRSQRNLKKIILYGAGLCGLFRSLVYLVDPGYNHQRLDPYLLGLLFGSAYPILTTSVTLQIFALYEAVSAKVKSDNASFLGKTKKIWLALCLGEYATQIVADCLRAAGIKSPMLAICQIYFCLWGLGPQKTLRPSFFPPGRIDIAGTVQFE